ncbi:peptidoglycan-binding domain-containing protein [Phormidesmis priestleyi]
MNGSCIRAATLRRIQRSLCHYGTLTLLWVGCFAPVALSQNQDAGQSTPVSILRPLLRSGSRGAEVTELQAALKLLGYYDGSVDGFYGDTTVTAVSRFQQAAGLAKDGIVGTATWDRLFPATVSDLPASKPASSPAPAPIQPKPVNQSAPPTTIDFPILKLGSQGTAVTRLQERLKAIGIFRGAIDGVFGAETQSAVKAAQSKLGLEPDGIVGGATWSALMR